METPPSGSQNYRDLLDFAPVGYLVTDPEGCIIEADRAVAILLLVEASKLIGRPMTDVLIEADRAGFRQELDRLARTGEIRSRPIRLRRKGGIPIVGILTGHTEADHDHQSVIFRWLIDVAADPGPGFRPRFPGPEDGHADGVKRPVVEGHLSWLSREPEAGRLRNLIDGIDAVIYEADPDGRIRFVNRRAVELFGYPEERWYAQPDFRDRIVHPDDRVAVRAHFNQCARYGQGRELEYRIIAADGRVIWVGEALRAARNFYGGVEALRGVIWRIGRRNELERRHEVARLESADQLADMEQLHELSRRLWNSTDLEPLLEDIVTATTMIQGAEMGMLRLLDAAHGELRIVASVGLCDEYLERYARVSTSEASCGLAIQTGQPVIIEDVETDPSAAPYREAARIGGYRSKYSTLLVSRGGEVMGTIATCFRRPHRPGERQIRLVELFARQAADFIENARLTRALREADRRKNDAMATLGHELRNPLGAILNAAALLEHGCEDPASRLENVDMIKRQARLMVRLANDLLEAARASRSELLLACESMEIGPVMARVAEAVRPVVQERGQKLELVLPPDPIRLEADPIRLEQILANLLTNASRYTEPEGKISVEARSDGDDVEIRVRDTGIGIPAEILAHIFEPFVQGPSGAGQSRGGLGLGLALVKGLVERHGGTVKATSDGPGHGSEFVVRLPGRRP